MRGVRTGWWILWNLVIKLLSLFCWIFECYFWTWLWKLHKLMFDFWGLNGGIGLEIKGFDDTWYDKGFWWWELRFWLILLRILRLSRWLVFWVGVWMNQLWDCAGNKLAAGVLTTPMPRYFYIFPWKTNNCSVWLSGSAVPFLLYRNKKYCVGDIEKRKIQKGVDNFNKS